MVDGHVWWDFVRVDGDTCEKASELILPVNWCSITCRNELSLNIIELKQVIHRSGNPHKSN